MLVNMSCHGGLRTLYPRVILKTDEGKGLKQTSLVMTLQRKEPRWLDLLHSLLDILTRTNSYYLARNVVAGKHLQTSPSNQDIYYFWSQISAILSII
jgi:hypothetical protein